jgi:mRNA interferase MazF
MKGDVVVVPFPFTDRSGDKRRPALVIATLPGDDLTLCEITSHPVRSSEDCPLNAADFQQGGLPHPSTIRPSHLFTIANHRIIRTAGHLSAAKVGEVTMALIRLLTR